VGERAAALLGSLLLAGSASAYPEGTPSFQTDAAPYCAGCHSSRNTAMLEGATELAEKELAERKHVAQIFSGQKGYASLSETDRKTLAEQIRALDEASTVTLAAPARVAPGQLLEVRVDVTGGAGPAVGVALVDRAHRWWARPVASLGFTVAAPPAITGPDGALQQEWLARRPEAAGRNLSFVNVTGISSDAAARRWSRATVVFTLRAPERPGSYPLAAAYFYGTEKATVLGFTTDPRGRKEPRGGLTGSSGRILFSEVHTLVVAPLEPPPAPETGPGLSN
jgi:hypothetical protein